MVVQRPWFVSLFGQGSGEGIPGWLKGNPSLCRNIVLSAPLFYFPSLSQIPTCLVATSDMEPPCKCMASFLTKYVPPPILSLILSLILNLTLKLITAHLNLCVAVNPCRGSRITQLFRIPLCGCGCGCNTRSWGSQCRGFETQTHRTRKALTTRLTCT